MADAPHPDPETGLYAAEEDGKHESKTFTVSLGVVEGMERNADSIVAHLDR